LLSNDDGDTLEKTNMLEIPEIQTIVQQLNTTVRGKEITDVVAAKSPHGFAFYYGSPSEYQGKLIGKKWGTAKASGMFVEVAIEDATLLTSCGTIARFYQNVKDTPPKHQMLIEFADHSALVFTIQMYGCLMVYLDDETPDSEFYQEYYQKSILKPSPLSDKFTEEYFGKIVSAAPPKTSLKAILTTEQRIPGLGNGVSQDILFNARLNPQTKISQISPGDQKRLFKSIKTTLKDMTEKGGRDTDKNLFGEPGGYHTLLSSKTISEPCPDCGSWMIKKAFLGGSIYFCPSCQPLV